MFKEKAQAGGKVPASSRSTGEFESSEWDAWPRPRTSRGARGRAAPCRAKRVARVCRRRARRPPTSRRSADRLDSDAEILALALDRVRVPVVRLVPGADHEVE